MTDGAGRDVAYRGFRFPADLRLGTTDGVRRTDQGLVLADGAGRVTHRHPDDRVRRYAAGSWTSPPVPVGFGVREVVPSWTADTPGDSWLRVELRGWHGDAAATGWYPLAEWAAADHAVRRTSLPGQRDGRARVDTDTLVLAAPTTGWQVRVTLFRPEDASTGPVLRTVGAVAAGPAPGPRDGDRAPRPRDGDRAPRPYDDPPAPRPYDEAPRAGAGDTAAGDRGPAPTPGAVDRSGSATAWGTVRDVPRYSQRLHAGVNARWGGGGDSWCSPTCTSMVLAYWGAEPAAERYAWVTPPGPRPVVVHAARHCFDHAYAGAGNWPFNTAYAGLHGVDAFVTRLRSLAEAEAFVAAGIPLIVSAAFRSGEVPGLDYDTTGHLMVLVGFTAAGEPVLNDPYAPDDEGVRRTVGRDAFERAWQAGSGGVAYVVHPPDVPLPAPPAQANW